MRPLEQFSVLCIEGADAGAFLHAQLSNDILSLADGGSVMAAYCEPAGRVLAVVLVHRSRSSYYLVLHRSLESAISRRLRLYVLRSAVTIKMCTGEQPLFGVVRHKSAGWPYPVDSERWLQFGDSADSTHEDSDVMTTQQWQKADIRSGLAWLDSTTSGQFLPQALNLVALGAVDFNKGCYPGQEIIARSHYLGTVKRQLIRTVIPESIEAMPGQELYTESGDGEEQRAGEIVASVAEGADSEILAVVKTSACGQKLNCYINENKFETGRISEVNKLS